MNYLKGTSMAVLVIMIFSSCSIHERQKSVYKRNFSLGVSSEVSTNRERNKQASQNNAPDDKNSEAAQINESVSNYIAQIANKPDTLNHAWNDSGSDQPENKYETQKGIDQVQSDAKRAVSDDSPRKVKSHPSLSAKKPLKGITKNEHSKRKIAIVIGVSLLIMVVLGLFAPATISGMFVLGNPVLTALNVTSGFARYSAAVISWVAIFLMDLIVSVKLYKYYKKEKPKMALTSGILRAIYSIFLGVAIVQLLKVTITAPTNMIYAAMSSFNSIWGLGLIVFGLHLIALGILYKAENGKKWVTIMIKSLLIVAGIGYTIINVGILFAPNPVTWVALMQPIFLIPMILGEVFFAIWMLVKGGKDVKK